MTSPPKAIAPSLTVPVMRIDWPMPKTVVLLTPSITRALGSFSGGMETVWAEGGTKKKNEKGKRQNHTAIFFLLPFAFFLGLLLLNEFGPMVVGDQPRQQRN